MSKLYVRHLSDAELHTVCAEVHRPGVDTLDGIDEMLALMAATGYPALAGPLVGLFKRVITIDLSRGRSAVVLINPRVESRSRERATDREGCLALGGVTVRVSRPAQVTVTGLARTGQAVRIHAGGLLARILQHQIDHLDGLVPTDRVDGRQRDVLALRLRNRSPRCPLPIGTWSPA